MRELEFVEESQARQPFGRGLRLERYFGVPPIDVQQVRQQGGAYALPAKLGIDHEFAIPDGSVALITMRRFR